MDRRKSSPAGRTRPLLLDPHHALRDGIGVCTLAKKRIAKNTCTTRGADAWNMCQLPRCKGLKWCRAACCVRRTWEAAPRTRQRPLVASRPANLERRYWGQSVRESLWRKVSHSARPRCWETRSRCNAAYPQPSPGTQQTPPGECRVNPAARRTPPCPPACRPPALFPEEELDDLATTRAASTAFPARRCSPGHLARSPSGQLATLPPLLPGVQSLVERSARL